MDSLATIDRWQRDQHPIDLKRQRNAIRLRGLYEFLALQLFRQYEPTKGISARVSRDFLLRLEAWLANFSDEADQWAAFRSIEYFFFAGIEEFEELYRCAFDHVLLPWLVRQADLNIFAPKLPRQLKRELRACWPCPVTDSLRINALLHVTGLKGQAIRPDWLSLKELGDTERIGNYVARNGIRYLVLIEDFVGNGGQVARVLRFAARAFAGPILLIPLIICAPGDRTIRQALHELRRENITYKPVVILSDDCLVGPVRQAKEPQLFDHLRRAMKNGYDQMGVKMDGEQYGWRSVGSLVALYSNCPNNTPPIFHYESANWAAIFPRAPRA